MSIQDIANYVRQTPGNTNPSVIKSMVKSEIGEYVEEASNEVLRKLGIGTKSVPGVLKISLEMCQTAVANGSAIDIPDAGTFIPILNRPIAQNEMEKVVVILPDGNETVENADLGYISPNSNCYAVVVSGGIGMLVVNADTDLGVAVPKGTYIAYYNNEYGIGYVSEIHGILTETTTPISDKYLPGVCLPVVELETAIGDMAPLAEADSAKLNKAAASSMPIVCKCTIDTIPHVLVCNLIQPPIDSGNGAVYVTTIGSMGFQLMTQDGTNWMGGKLTA